MLSWWNLFCKTWKRRITKQAQDKEDKEVTLKHSTSARLILTSVHLTVDIIAWISSQNQLCKCAKQDKADIPLQERDILLENLETTTNIAFCNSISDPHHVQVLVSSFHDYCSHYDVTMDDNGIRWHGNHIKEALTSRKYYVYVSMALFAEMQSETAENIIINWQKVSCLRHIVNKFPKCIPLQRGFISLLMMFKQCFFSTSKF